MALFYRKLKLAAQEHDEAGEDKIQIMKTSIHLLSSARSPLSGPGGGCLLFPSSGDGEGSWFLDESVEFSDYRGYGTATLSTNT
jgi:hypothetical protein